MSTDDSSDRVRASDAEREHYARIVREATGEGRLSLDEGDERLRQVYAARFREELPALVADLPAGVPAGPVTPPPHHRPYGGFVLARLGVLLVVVALLSVGWAWSGGHFFWPAVPLLFLTFGVLRRARWARHRSW